LFVVHLLPYADSIVALDPEGRVAAQGTFSQLNAPDGYIRRYGLESLKEEATASKAEADDEAKKVDPLHNPEEENIPKAMDDEARRLGDRTVYKYYFQQIGTFNTVVFFGALLIWMVLLKFPGERHSPAWIPLVTLPVQTTDMLHHYRNLAQVVGRRQRAEWRC
jgi:ATP-binding cassette, subfamily C (CFTR/MRP), member 1